MKRAVSFVIGLGFATTVAVMIAGCGGSPSSTRAICSNATAAYARLWTDIGSAVEPRSGLRSSDLVDDVKQLRQAIVKLEDVATPAEHAELEASVRSLKTDASDPSVDVGTEAVAMSAPWLGEPLRGLKHAITTDCRALS